MPPVNILYSNIQSYHNKKHIINNYIENNDINCTLFVETKTKADTNTNYRDWNRMQHNGNLINDTARGGALVQLDPTLKMGKENTPRLNNPLNECIHFSIPFKEDKLHIFVIYIHPHSRLEENIFIKASLYKYSLIIGDFNMNKQKNKQLKHFTDNAPFKKIHTDPTFIMAHNDDTTPDLIVHSTNITNNINNVEVIPDLGSDHLSIKFELDLNVPIIKIPAPPKYNINKCNTENVTMDIENYIITHNTINHQTFKSFHNTLTQSITNNSPKIKQAFYTYTLPPYIIKMIKKKRQMYREYKINLNREIKTNINKFSKYIKNMIQDYKNNLWLETCKEIQNAQGKNYWHKIKKVCKYKNSKAIPTISENNTHYNTDKEKAIIFKQHFSKAYTPDDNPNFDQRNYNTVTEWHDTFFTNNTTQNNNIRSISEEEYYETLSIGKNSAPGFDLITRGLLKKLSPKIHEYILKMYNFCILNQYIPVEWKTGIIITIPKPNQDHSKTINYRPITMLSVIGKNFENIIKKRLNHTLEDRIPKYQFGFMQKCSTQQPLTILTNNIQTQSIEGKKSAAVFLDINKAFDSVWHKGLLFKLHQLQCPTYLIHLTKAFLTDRKLKIKINNHLSHEFSPLQGIPQGSPLSPILYNIYCHDIYNHLKTHDFFDPNSYILQYADDTALISHNTTLQSTIGQLQALTDNTMTWFHKWRIKPNPSKSQLIIFNHNIKDNSPTINIINRQISPQNTIKYLGITIDNKLNFNKHTKIIQSKATARANHFRSLTYKDLGINIKTATNIYKMICRPMLDYGSILFLNGGHSCKYNIEVAERKCLRSITKIRHPQNPLHNPSNLYLYQTTKIPQILDRQQALHQKFSQNPFNMSILDQFCLRRNPTIPRRKKNPSLTLYETLRS